MKTREQVTATGDFPVAPWLRRDIPARNEAWNTLRDKCAGTAAGKGLKLAEDQCAAERSMLWMRAVDGDGGEPIAVECSRAEAEFVRLRLSAWAEPA
jgi:hypothetical protein